MEWASLPQSAIRLIASHLTVSDRRSLGLACKAFHRALQGGKEEEEGEGGEGGGEGAKGRREVPRLQLHRDDEGEGSAFEISHLRTPRERVVSPREASMQLDWEKWSHPLEEEEEGRGKGGGMLRRPSTWLLVLFVALALGDVVLGTVGLAHFGSAYFDTQFLWVNGTRYALGSNVSGAVVGPRCLDTSTLAWTTCMSAFLVCCGTFAVIYVLLLSHTKLANFERWRLLALSLFLMASCPAMILACVVVNLSLECDANDMLAFSIPCLVLGLFFFLGFGVTVSLMELMRNQENGMVNDRLANVYLMPTDKVDDSGGASVFVGAVEEFS